MKPLNILSVSAVALAMSVTQAMAADAVAELVDPKGKQVGKVEMKETQSGLVRVIVTGTGLPQGEHGFHIHETGACEADDGFKSAGGHLAGDMQHGVMSEDGPHPGDLPNLHIAQGDNFKTEFFLSRLEMDEGGWFEQAGLFDDDGSAVVVHSGADDYRSQPSGNSGERIACGVLRRP